MADDIQNGWGLQALDVEQQQRRYQNAIVSGCAATDGTNAMEIDVASGEAIVAGSRVSVSATTLTLTSAASDPRKDVVYIDATGTPQVATGTAAPAQPSGETARDTYQPRPPDLSATDAAVVAEVWVAGGTSDTGSGDISYRRVFADGLFGSVDVNSFTLGADGPATSFGDISTLTDSGTDTSGGGDIYQFAQATDALEVATIVDRDDGTEKDVSNIGSGGGGEWTAISTVTDSDGGTTFDETFSDLGDASFDTHRIVGRIEATSGNPALALRVNGVSTSDYATRFADGSSTSTTEWELLETVNRPTRIGFVVATDSEGDARFSEPTIGLDRSASLQGKVLSAGALIGGSVPVSSIRVFIPDGTATTGKLTLEGKTA